MSDTQQQGSGEQPVSTAGERVPWVDDDSAYDAYADWYRAMEAS